MARAGVSHPAIWTLARPDLDIRIMTGPGPGSYPVATYAPGSDRGGVLTRPCRRGAHRKEVEHRMPRIRQQNVLAAQWAPNGGALGAPDLTLPDNQAFGANVFTPAV